MASAFKKNQFKSNNRKSQTLIESPAVKRMHNHPVAQQGWLLKRGSDGLMLWKKRWFVLSDYCLFYYKDTFEEKLLGSLILASYVISPCLPDEKGYKKFSFKAEHTNMRTYYFAAESQALMDQWIKALTLASLLEENTGEKRAQDISRNYLEARTQGSDYYPSPSHDMLKSSESQPVYANAPPKPKRLNESSSPECSADLQFRDDHFLQFPPVQNIVGATHRSSSVPARQVSNVNYERRNLDKYGKPNIVQPTLRQHNQSRQRASPMNTSKDNSQSPRNVSFNFPPRPHSVDFLEYASKSGSDVGNSDCVDKSKIKSRPKSSLSTLNANDGEYNHWSAEEYARKLRQSSMYVKPTARRTVGMRNETVSSNTSNSSQNSNIDRRLMKNDLRMRSEKELGTLHRSQNAQGMHEKGFSRSASARQFRPMRERNDDFEVPNTCNIPPGSKTPENYGPNMDCSNKFQKQESMKRLLEWKDRMVHSPLIKKIHANMKTADCHADYTLPNKIDSYHNESISSCGSRNESVTECAPVPNDPGKDTEKAFCQSPSGVHNDAEKSHNPQKPFGMTFYNFSSSDDGLDGNGSKYGISLSKIENCNPQKDRRRNFFDINNKLLNETNNNSYDSEPFDPIKSIRLQDTYDYSEDKAYSNLESGCNVGNKIESPTNSNSPFTSNHDEVTHNKIPVTNLLHDFSTKGDKKQSSPIYPCENEKDEEWGIKLDESRVIKEFSYHYITSEKYDESQNKSEIDSYIHNNYKNKIKPSIHHNVGVQNEKLSSLKISLLQSKSDFQNLSSNEMPKKCDGNTAAKEGNIFQKLYSKSQRKSNKGNIISKGHPLKTYRKENNKSKDLINNCNAKYENSDKRLVQSDSEALLYDTSSDMDDKIMFHRDHLEKTGISSDDERDEEVAAVLAKDKFFTNPGFESVKSPFRNRPSSESIIIGTEANDISSINMKMSSGNEQNSHFHFNHEQNPSTSTDMNSDIQEENYMPMTPRKKSHSAYKNESIHSRSNSASHTLIIENLLESSEECPYVEMTQSDSNIVTNNSFHHNLSIAKNECPYDAETDSVAYCEIGKEKDSQYEMIYNVPAPQEPLYMEVPNLKERDANATMLGNNNESIADFNKRINSKESINQMKMSSRPSLPDILNTTTPTLNQGESGRSDSSDADDEASKDLDSLDAPRHPRFSLSDTFRPASYYLGASLGDRTIIALNTEHPDSSDSDLVSPPPIPTSSPPLDDLETSIDSTIVNKDSSHSHLKSESSIIYSNQLFLHSSVKDMVPSYKMKHSLRNSNLYEASSEESVNYEKKEQRLKRRPLSADILSSLQDINFMTPSDVEMKGNDSPDEIKLRSVYGEEQECVDSDHLTNLDVQKCKNNKYNSLFSVNREVMVSSETLDSESEVRYKNNRFNYQEPIYNTGNIKSSIPIDSKIQMKNQYENVCGDVDNNDYNFFIEKYKYKVNADCYKDKPIYIKETQSEINNSNENQNNAPYYYSDILKVDTKNFQGFDNNRWEEHMTIDNKKVLTFFTNEKPNGNMAIYNHYSNKSDMLQNKPSLSEDFRDINSSENGNYDSNIMPKQNTFEKANLPRHDNYSRKANFINISSSQQEPSEMQTPHRTRSLEGLLDNHPRASASVNSDLFKNQSISKLIKSQSQKILPGNIEYQDHSPVYSSDYPANQDIWEEDTLWRESLRKVSIRHTRSLENLDRKDGSQIEFSPSPKIQEEAKTYENISIAYKLDKNGQNYATDNYETVPENIAQLNYDMHYPNDKSLSCTNHEITNTIDNETHSVNSDQRGIESLRTEHADGSNGSFEIDREKLRQWDLMSSAPAMLSSNRAIIKPITERKANYMAASIQGCDDPVEECSNKEITHEPQKMEKPISYIKPLSAVPQEQDQGHTWNLKVSAGDLLGRTHEELVLLLIQLRRQRATVCQSMEKCHREIEAKACTADLDKANRIEHLQKLDELKSKLAELEKQYEKGKPLVNLVDNMVKLGSLYQAGSPQKLEFIQRIQEQRLLAEERRDWERIRPDHHELKAKVERLYRLDRVLQEESGALHNLQMDKGVLERAIGGLRNKLQGSHGNSPETEWYKRQQRLLERELSRVRSILALNSKKLEETVAENARLEQELVVLRQKLQHSRRSAEPGSANTAALESELSRVQLLVGNLLRQRQELSVQVRQLTEKSNSLSRQIWPHSPDHLENYNVSGRKQLSNGWIETDLDADITIDSSNILSPTHNLREQAAFSSPLYVNTTEREVVGECCNYQDELFDESPLSARSPECRVSDCNDEDYFKHPYGLHLKEKPQEIKTVRIVKRESERRQRDRDRSGNIGIPITSYTTPKRPVSDDRLNDKIKNEKDLSEECKALDLPPPPGPRTDSVNAVWNLVRKNKMKGKLITKNSFDKSDSLAMQTDSPQLSPVYLSETARKIVEEVAWQGMGEKRLIPKEKRRHHTMSGPSLMAPQKLYSQKGSRDDLDIERVLRPRLTTPDVVRSTLIKDPHYTKETIDNILGAPGKILIPERYIPETQPQLTREEQNKRSKKADAIRKMLCETASVPPKESDADGLEKSSSLKRKVAEEKKNREHLLQLNQILAKQVMEKSKIVAGVSTTSLE